MRFTFKSALVALVAVLVLGAVASASASAALPEFVHGEGEAFPISLSFSSKSVSTVFEGPGFLSQPGCNGASFSGEVTAAKSVSLTTEFEGCRLDATNICSTKGAAAGHVVLPWSGTLVYIDKATKQVGIVLKLTEKLIFECGSWSAPIKGSILIPVTPINTKTSKLGVAIHHGKAEGQPEYKEYENEKGEVEKTHFEVGTHVENNLNVAGEPQLAAGKSFTISG
ncbi:MAG TPA: hypothetical protein VN892_04755 [Solirubrobacteraceae bacterium]|nr:hypothetical protein [Solirubrobacteraceae bacterium]